jgi:cytochrome c oxidase subunit IV
MAERIEPVAAEGSARVRRGRRERHFGPREYIRVAAILGLITVLEVWIYYVDALEDVLVPLLLVFSALKFSLVVLYFMHLRFDSRSFATLFLTGMSLALTVFVIVLLTFGVFSE